MTTSEKKAYIEMKTLGYWSIFGGVEVKEYQYGIEDYAVVVANAWAGNKSVHRRKVDINYNGESYITLFGRRLKFNECIACRV